MRSANLSPTLEQLGLTRIEASIYLTLLENGSQQAGAITKSTGIHRRTVYDAIARLVEKGLVSYIRSNTTKIYEATHPERLMELLKEQERSLASQMKQLEGLYDQQPARHETVFFRGKRGVKALFDDQLTQSNSTILMLGATTAAVEQLKYYFPSFDRMRVQRKIKVKLLFDQRAKGKSYVNKIPLSESKVIQVGRPQDVVTCIYGDSVAIVTFSEKPFGILIREQAVAMQYRNYFELFWKK
jgi:sugar-specific transcriptional regulator TrmB